MYVKIIARQSCDVFETVVLVGFSFYRATQLCYRGLGSRNSVRLSVRLSHTCFVTNPENIPAIFLYHMKGQSF